MFCPTTGVPGTELTANLMPCASSPLFVASTSATCACSCMRERVNTRQWCVSRSVCDCKYICIVVCVHRQRQVVGAPDESLFDSQRGKGRGRGGGGGKWGVWIGEGWLSWVALDDVQRQLLAAREPKPMSAQWCHGVSVMLVRCCHGVSMVSPWCQHGVAIVSGEGTMRRRSRSRAALTALAPAQSRRSAPWLGRPRSLARYGSGLGVTA
jgi:hypothetical protein